MVSSERDRARQDLQGALASLEKELEERYAFAMYFFSSLIPEVLAAHIPFNFVPRKQLKIIFSGDYFVEFFKLAQALRFVTDFFYIYFRAGALKDASEQIKSLELKLDSTVARNQAEKQAWEEDLRVLEETWRRN